MTLLIGVVSALAAFASLPRWKMSTFLTLLSDLFAIETVLFGLADLVALLGYWPKAYEEYSLPRYLPLATALFVLAIFGVSHFRLVRKMMTIADPFFAARTPISIRLWPVPPMIVRQEPLWAHQRLLFDPHQPVSGRAGAAVQLLPERFRQRHPGGGRGASGRLLVSASLRLRADRDDRDRGRHRRILRRLEFRAAMATLDDRILHLALASALDALQAGAQSQQRRQPRPTHLAGHRRLHQWQRDGHQFGQRRHLQLHHPGDLLGDESGLVLDHPVGDFERA